MSALVVGQVLHLPPGNHRSGWTEYTIEKIGRKWATLNRGYRCDLSTLMLDRGGYSPKQLYVNRSKFEGEQALRLAWWEFSRRLPSTTPPKGVTLETIAQAEVLLGIEKVPA